MNGQMLGQSRIFFNTLKNLKVSNDKTYKILLLLFFSSKLCVAEASAARAWWGVTRAWLRLTCLGLGLSGAWPAWGLAQLGAWPAWGVVLSDAWFA